MAHNPASPSAPPKRGTPQPHPVKSGNQRKPARKKTPAFLAKVARRKHAKEVQASSARAAAERASAVTTEPAPRPNMIHTSSD